MAAQPSPLSVEEFHRRFDGAKPAYEYWFGEAVRKPLPTMLHGIVQYVIAMLLERAGWFISLEARLKVVPGAEPVPDVIAVKNKPKGSYPTQSPELCVEVLSPSDRLSEALEKARRYLSWGSQGVWIIDPEKRTAWTCSSERPSEPTWISPTGVLRIAETAIELQDLFAEVDQRLELGSDESEI
jgi:Uma2 family endonuclease